MLVGDLVRVRVVIAALASGCVCCVVSVGCLLVSARVCCCVIRVASLVSACVCSCLLKSCCVARFCIWLAKCLLCCSFLLCLLKPAVLLVSVVSAQVCCVARVCSCLLKSAVLLVSARVRLFLLLRCIRCVARFYSRLRRSSLVSAAGCWLWRERRAAAIAAAGWRGEYL